MPHRRHFQKVVATGMSMITPLGRTMQQNWEAILNDQCAFEYLPDQHGHCRIGGRLPEYIFPETSMKTKVHGLAKALAVDCLEDANMDLKTQSDKDKWRTGCIIAN